ncbi:MAG: hypothetical protein WCA14_03685 [Steroidobacteraceae bacterium]
MQIAIPAMFNIAVVAYLVFELLVGGRTTWRSLNRWAMALALIGFLAALPLLALLIGAGPARFLADLGALFLGSAAGVLVGVLVARLAESQHEWRAEHLSVLYLIVLLGLWTVPDEDGSRRAEQDGDPVASQLSVATVRDDPGAEWRVVAALDKQFLIVLLTPHSDDRRFRLIDSADVLGIRAAPPAAKPPGQKTPERR